MKFKAFAFLISLTIAPTALGQSSGEIAYFHVDRVKPGMRALYETARKRHWVWHQPTRILFDRQIAVASASSP